MNNWTWLVYMGGDNDLIKRAEVDIREMEQGTSADVSVGVHLDLSKQNTRMLEIANKRRTVLSSGPNQNSGDPTTLANFLRSGRQHFGATKYAVVLWNHGAGLFDFATEDVVRRAPVFKRTDAKFVSTLQYSYFTTSGEVLLRRYTEMDFEFRTMDAAVVLDETSKDMLEGLELRNGIADSLGNGEMFEIIGCDACFMSMLEVVFDLRNLAQVFVGSQELEEDDGWPYTEALSQFKGNLTVNEAAAAIIVSFRKSSAGRPKATLSAIQLDQVDGVTAALDALGAALRPLLQTKLREIAIAKAATKFFKVYAYIDLLHFARNVRARLPEVTSAADAVIAAVEAAVLMTSNHPPTTNAHGLSIYLPDGKVNQDYPGMPFSAAAPNWSGFVEEYGLVRPTLT